MKLWGQFTYTQVVDSTHLSLGFAFGFASTPNPTNGSTSLTVTMPTILTEALITQEIAKALKDYVNTTYSTSFATSDVIFIGSGVTIPSL